QGHSEEGLPLYGIGRRQDFLPQRSNHGIAAGRDVARTIGAGGQMKRRNFVGASAGVMMAAAAESEPPKNQIFHLVYFYMRTGSQVDRTTQYLANVFLPAAKRAGFGPVGFFSPVIAPRSPFILSLATYPTFASIENIHNRFAEDKEFAKGWDEYNNIADPAYIRMESTMLRAFDRIPELEAPPADPK